MTTGETLRMLYGAHRGGFNPLFSGEGSVTTDEDAPRFRIEAGFNPLFSGEGSVTPCFAPSPPQSHSPVSIPSSAGRGL